MKLSRLEVSRLPGVERPFALGAPGTGFNILVGPNGIGKSRLCAAVRCLLWDGPGAPGGLGGLESQLTASALFEHEGVRWRVERDGPRVSWQRDGADSGPPPLPGGRLSGCFFLGLSDLLDASDRAGRDLAAEIRLQMSGGFDLDAVQRSVVAGVPARVGSKEARQLSETEGDIRKASAQQRQVEESERQLAELEAEAAEAREAQRRIGAVGTALQVASWRRELEQQEAELAGLPQELARLDGKEAEAVEALEGKLATARAERTEALRLMEEAEASAAASGLDEPIGERLLGEWLERAEVLPRLEDRCAVLRDRAASHRSKLTAARRVLGQRASDEPAADSPDLEGDAGLFTFLRDAQQLDAQTVALAERLEVLAAHADVQTDEQRVAALRRAVGPLREWLRSPGGVLAGAAPATELWPGRTVWLGLGGLLVVVGAGWTLLLEASAGSWLALGAGLAALAAGLATRLRSAVMPGPDLRAAAQDRFPAGLEVPSSWTPEAVAEHLSALEEELAALQSAEQVERLREADRAGIEVTLKGLAERGQALELARNELAARLGLDELRPDAELVDMARALDAARAAEQAAQASATEWEQAEAERERRLAELGAFLAARGEAVPADAASGCAAIRSLQARDRALTGARETRQREERQRERLDAAIDQLEADAAALFERAGLAAGDRAGLTLLLARRPRYLELVVHRDQTLDRIRAAAKQLDDASESGLLEWDDQRLVKEQAALEEQAERASALDQQIGGIRVQIREAREGHQLEEAMARRDEALAELRERRDEALDAAAGSFLLGRVRSEHETHQMPRVLERARSRFSAFTHQRYQLDVSSEDGGSFVAIDQTNGRGLGLDKLSDGTRAQLILAARLAFADEVEAGSDLPLFLDEALDHSDPERFHAIARCLARMVADEGRQVFYLSNDPTDGQRFQAAFREEQCTPPEIIDLAELMGAAWRADGLEQLQVDPLPQVPAPVGHDPESYGVALGVTVFDPRRGASAQHVYHLLRDDLPLLHRLLELRIETVGQCRALLAGQSETARQVVSTSRTGDQLAARLDLLETYCGAWAEGRGRPVGRAEIEQSEAVTPRYLEAVVDAAAALGGDATQLLAELEATKPRGTPLSGFHSSRTERLERYFAEHGYLDDRPVLTEEEVLLRLLTTPAAQRLSPPVATTLVHEWWTTGQRER